MWPRYPSPSCKVNSGESPIATTPAISVKISVHDKKYEISTWSEISTVNSRNLNTVEISYFWTKTEIFTEIWAEISVKNPVMVGCQNILTWRPIQNFLKIGLAIT